MPHFILGQTKQEMLYINEQAPIELDEYTCSLKVDDLTQGSHELIVKAYDRAGNFTTSLRPFVITREKSILYSGNFSEQYVRINNKGLIDNVPINNFLLGVVNGPTNADDGNFNNVTEYKEGFKAALIAAYRLLLSEINENHSTCDIYN